MIKHVATASFGNLLSPVASFAAAPILAHALGVDGRGELAAVSAPYLLATVAATFGIPEALTYHVARRPDATRQAAVLALWLLAATGIVGAAAIYYSAEFLAPGRPAVAHLIRLSAIGLVPALLVTGLRAVAAADHRWRTVTNERAYSAGLRLLPLAVLAYLGSLTTGTAFAVIVISPILGGLAYRRLLTGAPRLSARSETITWRDLATYGSRAWVGSVFGILLSRLDQILMIPLSGNTELGLYAVAVNISEMTLILNAAVAAVVFSADAQGRNDERIGRAARINTTLSAATALILGLPMVFWVPVLFGTDFVDAIPVAGLLLIAVVIGTPGSVAGAALAARGRPGLRSAALIAAALLNAALLVALVPTLGAVGAAIATLVGNAFAGWANVISLRVCFAVPVRTFVGLRREDASILIAAVQSASKRLPRR